MKTINQNILNIESGIIGHQVNCCGVMGAGLALKLRSKYPTIYGSYLHYCDRAVKAAGDCSLLLGMVQPVRINKHLVVLNLFGQLWYGKDKRHTNYNALKIISHKLKVRDMTPYLPYRMGCGLGGGEWEVVQEIFSDIDGYWCKINWKDDDKL